MKSSAARGTALSSTSARPPQSLKLKRMQLPMLISFGSSAADGKGTAKREQRGAGGYINGRGAG